MSFIILIIQELIQLNPFAASFMETADLFVARVPGALAPQLGAITVMVDPFPPVHFCLRKLIATPTSQSEVVVVCTRVMEALAHNQLLAFRWKAAGRRLPLQFWRSVVLPVLPSRIARDSVKPINLYILGRSLWDQLMGTISATQFSTEHHLNLPIEFPIEDYEIFEH